MVDIKERRRRRMFSEGLLDNEAILEALNILPEQTILDAGCGNGYMSRELSSLVGDNGKIYAIDIDTVAIDIVKETIDATNVEAMVADITKRTPLDDASIDLIYLSTVFHAIPKDKIDDFLKEVNRLLKPGAKLAVVEINKEETPFGPPLEKRYSPEDLKSAIPLAPRELIDAGQHFYMQVFEKG